MIPRQPTIEDHGLVAEHDQACAVFQDQPAVLDCRNGVFKPSWRAQQLGWTLVKVDTRWRRFAYWLMTGKRAGQRAAEAKMLADLFQRDKEATK